MRWGVARDAREAGRTFWNLVYKQTILVVCPDHQVKNQYSGWIYVRFIRSSSSNYANFDSLSGQTHLPRIQLDKPLCLWLCALLFLCCDCFHRLLIAPECSSPERGICTAVQTYGRFSRHSRTRSGGFGEIPLCHSTMEGRTTTRTLRRRRFGRFFHLLRQPRTNTNDCCTGGGKGTQRRDKVVSFFCFFFCSYPQTWSATNCSFIDLRLSQPYIALQNWHLCRESGLED